VRDVLPFFEPHLSFTSPSGYGLNEKRLLTTVFFVSSVFTLSSVPEYVPHLSFTSPSGYGLNENKNEKQKSLTNSSHVQPH
jgi:hypothetical protein